MTSCTESTSTPALGESMASHPLQTMTNALVADHVTAVAEQRHAASEHAYLSSRIKKRLETNPTRLPINMSPAPEHCPLAAWQITRIVTYIDENIDALICTADLSALARLSPFHFCRAFRSSLGISPHQYVMRIRIEHAKHLMLQTSAPLSQIAADCGLADQAHLTRLFRRFVGKTPRAWRRAQPAIAE